MATEEYGTLDISNSDWSNMLGPPVCLECKRYMWLHDPPLKGNIYWKCPTCNTNQYSTKGFSNLFCIPKEVVDEIERNEEACKSS